MPSYKVIYFDMAGRAEPIRMLLKYGNLPFTDERIKGEDWPKIKPTTPLGQLPVLEVDGVKLAQSTAIYRYLGNEVGLGGKNNKENLAIDTAVYTLDDLSKLGIAVWQEQDAEKKNEKKQKFKEMLPFYLGKLEENAKKNGGYLAINRLSWADIVFLNTYEALRNLNDGEDIIGSFPNLQKVNKNVLSVDNIKNWIKNRPEGSRKPPYDLKHDL